MQGKPIDPQDAEVVHFAGFDQNVMQDRFFFRKKPLVRDTQTLRKRRKIGSFPFPESRGGNRQPKIHVAVPVRGPLTEAAFDPKGPHLFVGPDFRCDSLERFHLG